MLPKSDHSLNSSSSSLTPPVTPACVNCGKEERRFLHHVRHRGIFRRLCTTCVLRLNPQSFCPTCFQVYPPPPSNDAILSCFKCYSSTHSHCVSAPVPTPYVCPLCANPNVPIFELKGVAIREGEDCRVMDRENAKKLLAAAKIAALSMTKAAAVAKAEAEKRSKEAAFARKRAKEALDHVAYLMVKEKVRKKETGLGGVGDVSGSGVRGGFGVAQVKIERNVNVVSYGNGNRIVGNNGGTSVVVEENSGAVENGDRVENSNHVLAALNAVELKENGKISGTPASSVELGVPMDDGCVAMMDVDENGAMNASSGADDEGLVVDGNDDGDIDPAGFTDLENGVENFNEQEVDKEVIYVQNVTDQLQYKENGTGGEQHANGGSL